MSLHGAYDAGNIFAKIIRGEAPCFKVFEDDVALAFMDLFPIGRGHTLVIPKTPARNVLDASPEQLAACLATVQRIARAQVMALGAQGITLQQFNEAAGGQVVFHLHYHVMPRHDGVALRPHTGTMAPSDVLRTNADRLRLALTT